MLDSFEGWEKDEYVNGSYRGARLRQGPRVAASGAVFGQVDGTRDDAGFALGLIYFVGETLDRDFYSTWNSRGIARLYRAEGEAILAVIDLGRPDDDEGPHDTPTIVWRRQGDAFLVVASKRFRDTKAAELAGVAWPERSAFAPVEVHWGE